MLSQKLDPSRRRVATKSNDVSKLCAVFELFQRETIWARSRACCDHLQHPTRKRSKCILSLSSDDSLVFLRAFSFANERLVNQAHQSESVGSVTF